MRKKYLYLIPLVFLFFFQGCLKDKMLKTYTILKPVYKSKTEVYANIKSNAPAEVKKPGKIFLYGNYIFLNEVDKGVHIIDNSNPANPVLKAFINIPGNIDIAVKGNTLYADLYTDLVVVDITDPMNARFVKYFSGIFPERTYTNGFIADSSRVIVDWISKDTTIRIDNYCSRCDYLMASQLGGPSAGPMTGPSAVGLAGSTARFSILNDYLYTVNRSRLTSFNISNTIAPVQTSNLLIGWNIETIYPFLNKLFIGSMTGMFIYDVTNPGSPVLQGQFSHVQSCDPVIADGNYAYVTLRAGNNCGNSRNQLDVLNITNMSSPTLTKSYSLTNPAGLSKDNNLLFICDGKSGLKIYDATNPVNLTIKQEIKDLEPFDAIAYNGNLLVVAGDGLYQYQYSFAGGVIFKSKIAVNR